MEKTIICNACTSLLITFQKKYIDISTMEIIVMFIPLLKLRYQIEHVTGDLRYDTGVFRPLFKHFFQKRAPDILHF